MMRKRNDRQRGFTLLELMIVVAVIAILAAVALPSYQRSVLHGRRAEASSLLEQNRAALESCYAQNFSYTASACPALTQTSEHGYYALAAAPATSVTASAYTLTAIPQGAQAGDTDCATFTITSANVRTATNAANADNTSTCWAK